MPISRVLSRSVCCQRPIKSPIYANLPKINKRPLTPVLKSRIRETKHPSTNVDSSTDTKKILLGRLNFQKKTFFAQRCYTFYRQQFSNPRPFLSIPFPQGFRKFKKFGHWALGSFQIWDHFFPLLFPKDSENLKSLDIGLWEVRAKRRLNGVNKWKKSVRKTCLPLWF